MLTSQNSFLFIGTLKTSNYYFTCSQFAASFSPSVEQVIQVILVVSVLAYTLIDLQEPNVCLAGNQSILLRGKLILFVSIFTADALKEAQGTVSNSIQRVWHKYRRKISNKCTQTKQGFRLSLIYISTYRQFN